MKKRSRRVVAILVMVLMIVSLLPMQVFAAKAKKKGVKVEITLPKDAQGNIVSGIATAKVSWKGKAKITEADISIMAKRVGMFSADEWKELLFGTIGAPENEGWPNGYKWSTSNGRNTYKVRFPYVAKELTDNTLEQLDNAVDTKVAAEEAAAVTEAAQQDLTAAKIAEDTAKDELDDAIEAKQALENSGSATQTELNDAQDAVDAAQTALDAASADVTTAQGVLTAAENELSDKNTAVTNALDAIVESTENTFNESGLTCISGTNDIEEACDNALKNAAKSEDKKISEDDKNSVLDTIMDATQSKESDGTWETLGGLRDGDAMAFEVWEPDEESDGYSQSLPVEFTVSKEIDGKTFTEEDDPANHEISFVNVDGRLLYMVDGVQDTEKYGFVDYNGSKFLVANGEVVKSKNGLAQDPENPGDWYFVAGGQVTTNVTKLVMYDGSTFYVKNGKLDNSVNGFLKYDTGLFFVSKGRVVKTANGLVQDPNKREDWYFTANGQVQKKKTGVVIYNKAGFYVNQGKLDTGFNGDVPYAGKTVRIRKGRMTVVVN